MHWVGLNSTDNDADVAWLTASFGYTTRELQSPRGRYTELLQGWPTSLMEESGRRAMSPIVENPAIGRMDVVSDPAGAVFGIIQPATA